MHSKLRMACLAATVVTGLAPVAASSATASAAAAPAASSTVKWPGFHDNAADTGYNASETTVGPGNVAGLQQQWLASTEGPDSGNAPTIAGGRVFTNGGGLQAWNASTGALEWSAPTAITQYGTSAAYGDGRVFADSATTLYAYNAATGKLSWSVAFDGAGVEPVYADGLLYAVGNASVTAYQPATGATVWTAGVGRNEITRSVPAVYGGSLFLAVECCRLIDMNASTGSTIWNKDVGSDDGTNHSAPVVSGDLVYLCSGSRLFALTVTGKRKWTDSGLCSSNYTPALANGVLYAQDYSDGLLDAVNAATGAIDWTAANQANDYMGPIVANGVVYYPTGAGTIAAYDVSTGDLLWTSPDLGFGDDGASGPALLNGMLYVGGSDGLYVFGLGG